LKVEKKNEFDGTEMSELEKMLASEGEITPSSGFLSAVMERVEEEASAPKRIPFPWVRALPGIAVAVGLFGWMGVELVRAGVPAMGQGLPATLQIPQVAPGMVHPLEQAGWVALGLGLSAASWLLTRRLAGRGELL
jgi:hypothetical protein